MGEKCLINDPDLGTQQTHTQPAKQEDANPKAKQIFKGQSWCPLSHTDKELLLKTHERQQTPLSQEGFSISFWGFLQKTSKISEFYKAYFNSIQLFWKLQQFHLIQVFLQLCYPKFPCLITAQDPS